MLLILFETTQLHVLEAFICVHFATEDHVEYILLSLHVYFCTLSNWFILIKKLMYFKILLRIISPRSFQWKVLPSWFIYN